MPTHSSTSSSEVPIVWSVALGHFIKHVLLVGTAFLLIGELWFRMPWTTKILLYEFDDRRSYRLVPRQSRSLGLGNFSVMSPPIGINSDGFRNAEIDWSAPTILAVGSSEVLGPGIEDHEAWTAVVSERLSTAAGRRITVVNTGTPAYGPYHQAVTVRKYLERDRHPRLVVVRASVTDRRFTKPTESELDAVRRHFAVSSRIRRFSEFLPFLVNRMEAQIGAIQGTFAPDSRATQFAATDEAPAVADDMWRSQAQFWKEIVALATSAGVPVLFFVDGADGAASGVRLRDLLAEAFLNRTDVAVALLGARETGLEIGDDEARRRRHREQFLLGYDPHANARLHRVVAEFLTPIVVAQGHWGAQPLPQAAAGPAGPTERRRIDQVRTLANAAKGP